MDLLYFLEDQDAAIGDLFAKVFFPHELLYVFEDLNAGEMLLFKAKQSYTVELF